MFCSQCGKRVTDNMLFCPYCGAPIVIPEQEDEAAEAPKAAPTDRPEPTPLDGSQAIPSEDGLPQRETAAASEAPEGAAASPAMAGLQGQAAEEAVSEGMSRRARRERQERLEQERLEQERLEKERRKQERLEKERLEQERLEQERLEKERLEKERRKQERLEKERLEQERLERERLQKERAATRLFDDGEPNEAPETGADLTDAAPEPEADKAGADPVEALPRKRTSWRDEIVQSKPLSPLWEDEEEEDEEEAPERRVMLFDRDGRPPVAKPRKKAGKGAPAAAEDGEASKARKQPGAERDASQAQRPVSKARVFDAPKSKEDEEARDDAAEKEALPRAVRLFDYDEDPPRAEDFEPLSLAQEDEEDDWRDNIARRKAESRPARVPDMNRQEEESLKLEGRIPRLESAAEAPGDKRKRAHRAGDTYLPAKPMENSELFMEPEERDEDDIDDFDEDYDDFEDERDDAYEEEREGFFARHTRGIVGISMLLALLCIAALYLISAPGQRMLAEMNLAWKPDPYRQLANAAYDAALAQAAQLPEDAGDAGQLAQVNNQYYQAGLNYQRAFERSGDFNDLNSAANAYYVGADYRKAAQAYEQAFGLSGAYEEAYNAAACYNLAKDARNYEAMLKVCIEAERNAQEPHVEPYLQLKALYPYAPQRTPEITQLLQQGAQLFRDEPELQEFRTTWQ